METLLQTVRNGSRSRGLKYLSLCGLLVLWVAGAPANAKDMVPYADSLQMSVTAQTENDDGTTDQVIEGTGIATQLGKITLHLEIKIQPTYPDYKLFAWVAEFSGTAVETAANGETLAFSIVGREMLFVDKVTYEPIYPYRVEAIREVTSGTGRFQGATGTMTFSGTDEDYIISGVSTGEISSVGANKR